MKKLIVIFCAMLCLLIGGCSLYNELNEEYYTVSILNSRTGEIVYMLRNVTYYEMDDAKRGTDIKILNGHTANKNGIRKDFSIIVSGDIEYTAIQQDGFRED